MHEPVSAIMARDVVCVDTEDRIEQVEAVMTAKDHSFVPVRDAKGNIFGIITAQQIEHFRAAKLNGKQVRAWELCTYRPPQVAPDVSIVEVAALMVQKNIDHLVVTENESIVGVVTSLDIVKQYLLREDAREEPAEEHRDMAAIAQAAADAKAVKAKVKTDTAAVKAEGKAAVKATTAKKLVVQR